MPSKLFDVTVTVKHETAKAILVNDGTRDVWIPKSFLGDDGQGQLEHNADGTATLTAPEWWLTEKELI